MPQSLTLRKQINFQRSRRSRKVIREGKSNDPPIPNGRVPRISRLMALAIRFNGLIARGEITDQAELARLGHVSRARVTQIMNLLNLAPDIQEAILHLPLVTRGRDPIREHAIRPIAAVLDWGKQRRMWWVCEGKSLSNLGRLVAIRIDRYRHLVRRDPVDAFATRARQPARIR